jgi:hypothetical protein
MVLFGDVVDHFLSGTFERHFDAGNLTRIRSINTGERHPLTGERHNDSPPVGGDVRAAHSIECAVFSGNLGPLPGALLNINSLTPHWAPATSRGPRATGLPHLGTVSRGPRFITQRGPYL